MSVERIHKASKSFFWLAIHFAVVSIVPFIMRTAMIWCIGEKYVGLNSLFVSLLSILNLGELGINEALTYFLYKPMAVNDYKKANELLNLYKYLYRIIGIIIFFVSLIVVFFLPLIIKDEIPQNTNMYVVYVAYVLNNLIPYFYKSFCFSIFQTNQALYLRYKWETLIYGTTYCLQLIFIIFTKSYYGYVWMIPVTTFVINTVMWLVSSKYFPEYKPEGMPEKTFFANFWKKVAAMAIMKARDVFRFSLDSMVISVALGLTILARYNNYFMIFTVLVMLSGLFSKMMLQSFGNSVAVESVESNRAVIKLYSFLLQWVTLILCAGMTCLYNVFIICWIGERYTFSIKTVILFVIMFYMMQLSSVTVLIRNGTGIWNKGLWIGAVETVLNIILDIVLVRFFKQDGVIIGTIASLALVNIPFETSVVFKEYFKEKPYKVLGDYVINGVIAIMIIYFCYRVTSMIALEAGIAAFILKGIVCVTLSVVLFALVHIRDPRLKEFLEIILGLLKCKRK